MEKKFPDLKFFPLILAEKPVFPWFPWLEIVFKIFPEFPDFPDRWEPWLEQDSIPVGCIPPARQPYMIRWPPLDVSTSWRRGYVPSLMSGEGQGEYPTMWPIPWWVWYYLPPPLPCGQTKTCETRKHSSRMSTVRLPTERVSAAVTNCGQNSWHTPGKTLPFPNFVCGW